jgi:hypothetical protein
MAYKFGKFVGVIINLSFFVFFGVDAYFNIRDGKSAVLDVVGLILLLLAREGLRLLNNLYTVFEIVAVEMLNKYTEKEDPFDEALRDLTKGF